MEFSIRFARPSDAEEINKCLKLAFKEYEKAACYNAAKGALTEEVSKTAEDIENKIFPVAEFGDKIIGSVRVEIQEKSAYLSRFSVLPEYHKYGTGKMLLDEIDRIMLSKGVTSIYLHTSLEVPHLIRFYNDCGFEVESVSEDTGYKRARLRKIYGD